MATEMSDDDLKRELANFGEAVGKITAKTRPIYIKKLNHLRARQSMAEKAVPSVKKGPTTRRSTLRSSDAPSTNYRLGFDDDSDPEEAAEETSRMELRTRRKTVLGSNYSGTLGEPSPSRASGRKSLPAASPSRGLGESILSRNVSAHPASSVTQPPSVSVGSNHRNAVEMPRREKTGSSLMDFSDSELTEDELLAKDTASVGINTSAWMDASFGNSSSSDDRAAKTVLSSTPVVRSRPYRVNSQHNHWESHNLRSEMHGSNKWQCVSRLLFALFLVFLLALVPLYAAARFGLLPSVEVPATDEALLCSDSNNDKGCLTGSQKKLLVELLDILATRAGDHDCGSEDVNRSMSTAELTHSLTKSHDLPDIKSDFSTVIKKISKLSQLKIRLLDDDFQNAAEDSTVRHLESIRAKMSLICRLRKSFFKVMTTLLCVVGVAVAVGFCGVLVRRKLRHMEEEKKEVRQLVQDIISLLQHHASECKDDSDLEPYVPISSIRDALIPIAQRQQKRHLWDKAFALISSNESRVREEVQLGEGDRQRVWRWLDVSTDLPERTGQKPVPLTDTHVTQASAFLKVSNLLEGHKILSTAIRDAILDRCSSYHGILHVESYENCIYLKCVSESAAGQAFKRLHGWLYDGKLVSVRYVSPLFYRTLFPESVDAMVPLRSSTQNRRRSSAIFSGNTGSDVTTIS